MPDKTQNQQSIEKPWAVIEWVGYKKIERIVSEFPTSVGSQYSEKAIFDNIWGKEYVEKRFDTANEAIDYFAKARDLPVAEVREDLYGRFPHHVTPHRRIDAMEPGYSEPNDFIHTAEGVLGVHEDYGPFGKNPHLKDGPIATHPNKKY